MTAGPERSIGRLGPALALAMAAPVALVLVLFSGSPSSAQDGTPGAFAEVEIGVVGPVSWNADAPVQATVSVTASRAVSGVLVVTDSPIERAPTTYEFDIDLAAGSRAELPVTFTTGWNGVQGTAVLRAGDEVLAEDELNRGGDGDPGTSVVATLGVDDPPRRVPEQGGDRQLVTLELDAGLRGLDQASTLVGTPSALSDLGDGTIASLTVDAWIRGGGQLVVDGPARSLDDRFHRFPTANPDRFLHGAGSILYLEGWEDGLPLGGYEGSPGLAQLVESQGLGVGAAGELAVLANIALPPVGLIAGVLVGYTLLAGPVLFGVAGATRRQRRIWIALPALSLLVTGGVLTVGLIGRQGRSEAHLTIVEVADEGSRATTNMLLSSNFGGDRRIETPEGWTYLGQARTSGRRPIRLRVGRATTEVAVEMPPGSNAVIRMSGVDGTYDGLLTIDEIRAAGETGVTAQVTNHSGVDLREAVAFLGTDRVQVGEIPAGTGVEITIEGGDVSGRTMQELLLWPRVQQQWLEDGNVAVPTDRDAITAAGAWTEWRIDQGLSATPDDVIGVVAWTDELPGPVEGVDEGRTALFARTTVPADIHGPTSYRMTGRLPDRHVEPVFQGNFAGYREDFRITLGPQADIDQLALRVDQVSSGVAVQVGGQWRFPTLPDEGAAVIAIPAEAVVDGEIALRSFVPDWAWQSANTVQVVVDDAARTVSLGDEFSPRMGTPDQAFGDFGPAPAAGMSEVTELAELVPGEPYVNESQLGPESDSAVLFPIEADQTLTVTLHAEVGDPYLELWKDGGLLVEDDDGGGGLDSRITFTTIEGGQYEVRYRNLAGDFMVYELTMEVEE